MSIVSQFLDLNDSTQRTGGDLTMPPLMNDSDWDIRRAGRAWSGDEARQRWELTPEKLEMIAGRILWDEDERVQLLGLLLENVGADRAVRLGAPAVWRSAVETLSKMRRGDAR